MSHKLVKILHYYFSKVEGDYFRETQNEGGVNIGTDGWQDKMKSALFEKLDPELEIELMGDFLDEDEIAFLNDTDLNEFTETFLDVLVCEKYLS